MSRRPNALPARLVRAAAAVAIVVAFGPACAASKAAGVPKLSGGPGAAEVRADVVPATLHTLSATPEDIDSLEKEAGSDSWLSSTRLWSLRQGERLRATLQVGRFVPDAEADERAFQERIVAQVGSTAARPRMLGDTRVYVTSGNQQLVYVWFRGRTFFVLSAATNYQEPRALLRAALELEP